MTRPSLSPRLHQALNRLLAERREPLCAYLFDLPALQQHIQVLRQHLPPGCELYYAAKANPMAPLLATLAPWVHGFEAASGGELAWLAEQQPGKSLLFGGPGKLENELALALRLGVDSLHVESLTELERLMRLTRHRPPPQDIMLRMNIDLGGLPSTRLTMGGVPTPFGLDEGQLEEALQLLDQAPGLRLTGFHFHLMSQQLDETHQLALIRLYLERCRLWSCRYGLPLECVNVGGGIGVDYRPQARQFDWPRFCRGLAPLHAELAPGWRLRFECGRYVSAFCGYYLMEVLDIKQNHGEWFAIARGGTHHFRTPAAQGHSHPVQVIPSGRQAPRLREAKVNLVGQLCTPKDKLAWQVPVDSLAIGDLLLFPLAGAYAWNISHQQFLMHPAPEFVWLE